MMKRVGIEALAVAVPRRYVDIEDLARARGVDPAKFTAGLGAKEMAINDPGEDSVSLAATAAARLIQQQSVDTSKIGMLVVGTETGVDHSKPIASHVHGLLKLPRSMRTFDSQHACYGGTAGLMAAVEWIASGAGAGRTALVVCTDIARYGLKTAGEPTQGGGAVALLVSETPDLLALDVGLNGVCTSDVYDFWRPVGRREALVDGHYSITCYLDAMAGAYRGWRQRAMEQGLVRWDSKLPSEQLARILYHVPFCKMARKAHAQVRLCDLEDAVGPGPATPEARDESAKSQASYDAQVAKSLGLNARVGNVYTASLYLALAGQLHAEGAALANQRVGLLSYGSGCCAEFYSGVVGEKAAERMARADLDTVLAKRERVSVEEYERLMNLPYDAPEAIAPEPGTFRLAEIVEHRRKYAGA
ncbi:hydroxymethylglutaryl-CoA synthase family protein [Corallococcus praedator]|uniref:Hydroxymethylglutaryl-CoA synthase family protein n=1 Tax=Corallococcus praedator TaxID=2316724 RepID=A0ABX9QQD6_9BACT|nr:MULTISPECIES: hydroxymethylglutaryl-CoA synthase family protein [Corallococcus]RKH33784.1 hydroxymethylglutaryl-CoA synthase family protein [Corallococcus sp. CA031C]RKI16211.1 hydroxymethylglutaryl-CoA synthase family protein [Corallococcus praedator]